MQNEDKKIIQYEKFLVAFIDILGFSSRVKESVKNVEHFWMINTALEEFNKLRLKQTWKENNILIEVEVDAQRRSLNDYYIDNMAKCFCFSDSIIVTVKADAYVEERTSALLAMLAKIGTELLAQGILLRGAVTIGKMYVDKNAQSMKAFGPAVIEAYHLEEEQANYPRIILSRRLIKELRYPLSTDKQRQPYHQYLRRFDDGLVGFNQLTFLEIMQNTDKVLPKKKLREKLEKARQVIITGLDENMCNIKAFAKYAWLKEEFNKVASEMEKSSGVQIEINIKDVEEATIEHNIHYAAANECCWPAQDSGDDDE